MMFEYWKFWTTADVERRGRAMNFRNVGYKEGEATTSGRIHESGTEPRETGKVEQDNTEGRRL